MTDGEDIFETNIVMLNSLCSGSGVPQEPPPQLGTQVPSVPQKLSPKKEMKALHIPGKTMELEMTLGRDGFERKWVFQMVQTIDRNNEKGTVKWVSLDSKRQLYLMKIKDLGGEHRRLPGFHPLKEAN